MQIHCISSRVDLKYFLLSVTMKCNKDCSYCVVKDYLNNPEHPDKIDFGVLTTFLDNHMDDEDFAEITGGEPTTWKHFSELLDYLEQRKCYKLVRTNGFKPIDLSKYSRLYLYLAQHNSTDEWISDRFAKFNCKGLISNKDNIPVMVQKSTITETKIMEREQAQFSETYFIDNEARIRFLPCNDIFSGNLKEGITNNYKFSCGNNCPFKQGAWEMYKRIKLYE
jgi:MoaA/NifB/PqqE/SkfB family radical SAM enzyme